MPDGTLAKGVDVFEIFTHLMLETHHEREPTRSGLVAVHEPPQEMILCGAISCLC